MQSIDSLWLLFNTGITDVWFYNPTLSIGNTGISDDDLQHLTIHGYTGSTAEEWAKKKADYGVKFEPIPDGETMPSPDEIIASFEFYE